MCLETCFGTVPDPRARNVSHRLGDLIVMMVAASLCGATTATEFTLFAQTRRDALSRLIDYDTAPSHDTFSRLLRLMDPRAFERAFATFAEGFARALDETAGDRRQDEAPSLPDVVAIDGKALRRAHERGCQACPPLTVSAFATRTRLCLAAVSPTSAENEIEAALKTIDLIDLTDKIVTADALHCHTRMAEALIGRKADYMLALKGNRHHWRRQAEALLADTDAIATAELTERNHGRDEWRRAEVVAAAKPLMAGHAAFIRLTSQRDRQKPLVRLFMASKAFPPEEALSATRAHWQVENSLHWMLDVHLGEDLNRARKDHAPANIAILKRIARNILQTADSPKVPISHRIKKCAWSNDYLLTALRQMR
jgi:predicted transposase YbfD/YdcC